MRDEEREVADRMLNLQMQLRRIDLAEESKEKVFLDEVGISRIYGSAAWWSDCRNCIILKIFILNKKGIFHNSGKCPLF